MLVDLIGDGVPDLVVSANFSDDATYYRLVAIAPDNNPEAATTVMIEFGADAIDRTVPATRSRSASCGSTALPR